MHKYIASRLLLTFPTILAATTIVFFAIRLLVPGDAVDYLTAQEGSFSPQQIETFRRTMGIDRPVVVQYVDWVGRAVQGDFGTSLFSRFTVTELIKTKAPITAQLSLMAIAISMLLSFPFGIVSAIRPNSIVDYASRTISIASLSAPNFWLALLTILLLSKYIGWFPPLKYSYPWDDPWANLQKTLIPAIILGTSTAGVLTRYIRSALLEVLRQDYMTTARSKGLSEKDVILRHGMKNAMLPVFTVLGLQFATIFGGSVIIENIFSIPGMGDQALRAISTRDYPVVQGMVIVFAVSYTYVNLLVDLTYKWLDPRISY